MSQELAPGMTALPRVAALVLNWRGADDTLRCLAALSRLRYPALEILAIDNGSGDGSEEAIRAACPGLNVLQTGANLGYAGGNNAGIRWARSRGYDFVWLLNNDAIPESDALDAMVAAAAPPGVGMVGSKILYVDPPDRIWFAGGGIDSRRGLPYHIGQDETDRGQHDLPRVCEYLTGASLLVRAAVIADIGLLDDGYFLYYEDVDWCVRARAAGWRLVYAPTSVVRHTVGSASGGIDAGPPPRMEYYIQRNNFLFVWRHLRGWRRAVALFWTLRRWLAWLLDRLRTHRRQPERARAYLVAYLSALRDGLAGTRGRYPEPSGDHPDQAER